MATKVATVTVRIKPEIKEQAEEVLNKLGIPISVLIDSLYRQIILTGGIPYSISLPSLRTIDTMSEKEFDSMINKGIEEAKDNEGLSLDDAFKVIDKVI